MSIFLPGFVVEFWIKFSKLLQIVFVYDIGISWSSWSTRYSRSERITSKYKDDAVFFAVL